MRQQKPFCREHLSGLIIYSCLALVLLSMIGVRALDVQVINIEGVDRGLYTVVAKNGTVNVGSNDVLRVERTYTKAAITGEPVELDKIYTTKGFIYTSSSDPFYESARQLINSVDFDGLPIWEREGTSWQSVQPYAYAIGTPENHIPWLFFLLSLQNYALTIGGITLAILIFPMPWKERNVARSMSRQPGKPHDQEYHSEEQLNTVAK